VLDLDVPGELPGIVARQRNAEFIAEFRKGWHADRAIKVQV
jgi:hypothetical protein